MQRLPDRRYRPPASSTTTRSCHTLQVTELEPPAQPEAGQQHASLAWAECPRSGSACCLPGTRMARHPPGSRPTGGGRSPELSRECRAGSRYRRDDGGTDPPAGPVPRGCARAASSGDHRAPTAGEWWACVEKLLGVLRLNEGLARFKEEMGAVGFCRDTWRWERSARYCWLTRSPSAWRPVGWSATPARSSFDARPVSLTLTLRGTARAWRPRRHPTCRERVAAGGEPHRVPHGV